MHSLKSPRWGNAILMNTYNIWASPWENVSSGVLEQARHKPACAATEASWSLEISAIESRDIILSKQRTTKALIRLHGCAGWTAPFLFAYDIRHIFSWPGSYKNICRGCHANTYSHHNWAASWQNQHNGMCTQQRLRSAWAWASAQSDQSSLSAWRKLGSLATQWAAKTLIRLCRCPGWSESLLGAVILLVLSWGDSYEYQQLLLLGRIKKNIL